MRNINKKNTVLKLLLVLFGFLLVFFSFCDVNAENVVSSLIGGGASGNTNGGTMDAIQNLIKVLYIITWPVIIIAGQAMTNAFVYGEAFGMDKPLWEIWQFSRALANYGIGLMFIIAIFGYLWHSKKFDLKKTFINMMLAIVAVNASWFIVAALLDISNILTVSFSAMWMKLIGMDKNTNLAIPKITFDIEQKWEGASQMVSFWAIWDKEWVPYCQFEWDKPVAKACAAQCSNWLVQMNKWAKWCDDKANITSFPSEMWVRFDEIAKNVSDMSWPLVYMFRFMNASAVLTTNNQTVWSQAMVGMVKAMLLLVMLIPLLVLWIVLIVRSVIMRIIIGFSPLLFFSYTMQVWKKVIWGKMWFSDMIWIIFIPAVVSLALTFSIVFMDGMTNLKPESQSLNVIEKMWMEEDWANKVKVYSVDDTDFITLEIKSSAKWNETKSTWLMSDIKNLAQWLGWVVANLCAAILVWIVLFAAINKSKIGAKISWTFKYLWESIVQTMPIPMLWWHSVKSIKSARDTVKSSVWKLWSNQATKHQEKIDALFKTKEEKDEAKRLQEEEAKRKKKEAERNAASEAHDQTQPWSQTNP